MNIERQFLIYKINIFLSGVKIVMSLNLLQDAWLPIRRRNGERDIVALPAILEEWDTERAVVFPAWPRPDLNVATLELLIGILSVVMPPENTNQWHKFFLQPPKPDDLRKALRPLMAAFVVDGEGPRFEQDFDALEGSVNALDGLFIDSAGENTAKKNADLMVRRDRYRCLSRAGAAMALYALQQYAPTGGAGHRTSMRGGGPLTTLVLPPPYPEGATQPSLWHILWANVLPVSSETDWEEGDLPRIFPWMAPTITSEKGEEVSAADPRAHPLQAFFGMPRRIRLCFSDDEGCYCDLTEIQDKPSVTGYITQPRGVNYGQWRHPLSPYYRKKPEDLEFFALHPQPGRFGYRNWLAVVIGDEQGTRLPAQVVTLFRQERGHRLRRLGRARLLAAGWAMSNMRPLDYVMAEEPFHLAADADHQKRLDTLARRLVLGAEHVAALLTSALQTALAEGNTRPKADTTLLAGWLEDFYVRTEEDFHQILDFFARNKEATAENMARRWLDVLRKAALAIFDAAATFDPLDQKRAQRVIDGRKKLMNGLYHPKGSKKLLEILHIAGEAAVST